MVGLARMGGRRDTTLSSLGAAVTVGLLIVGMVAFPVSVVSAGEGDAGTGVSAAEVVGFFVEDPDSVDLGLVAGEVTEVAAQAISVMLPDQSVLSIDPRWATHSEVDGLEMYEWHGANLDVDGQVLEFGYASIAEQPDGTFQAVGRLFDLDRAFEVSYDPAADDHVLSLLDPSADVLDEGDFDPGEVVPETLPVLEGEASAAALRGESPATAPTRTIRVLGFYARDVVSTTASTFFNNQIAATNSTLANSGIDARLVRVGLEAADYDATSDQGSDLSRLIGTADPHMTHVHGRRDTLAADLVVLIRPGGCAGIASIPPSADGSAGSGFSAMSVGGCSDGSVGAHEWGHNMGGQHDPANAPSPSYPFSWSYAHAVSGTARSQVAYSTTCSSSCPVKLIYANPDRNFPGNLHPVGDGDPGQCGFVDVVDL